MVWVPETKWTRRGALTATALAVVIGAPIAPSSAGVFEERGLGGSRGWASASDGQRIRYMSFGQGSISVVFIHGWTCDRTYWNRQIQDFSRDYRVLTLDLVGHGESDKNRRIWSMEGLGDDVARVVRASGAHEVVLVGHSMGGPVAIEAARRLGTSVRGVVTIDILTTLEPPAEPRPPPLTTTNFRQAGSKMIREGMFLPSANPAVADRITRAMTSTSPQIALGLSDALNRYDGRAGLSAISSLPLAMIDAGGRNINVHSLRSAHPRARIFVIDKVGHFLMIDDPASFNGLLRSEIGLMDGRITSL